MAKSPGRKKSSNTTTRSTPKRGARKGTKAKTANTSETLSGGAAKAFKKAQNAQVKLLEAHQELAPFMPTPRARSGQGRTGSSGQT